MDLILMFQFSCSNLFSILRTYNQNNTSMAEQKASKYNLLSCTSRRFYSRKKPEYPILPNQPRISKVMKTLNGSCTMRKINKYQFLKTQTNERLSQDSLGGPFFSEFKNFNEIEFLKKELKLKIQMLLKKCHKKWKILLESYQDMKSCTDKQSLVRQQNKFYSLFADLLKINAEQKSLIIKEKNLTSSQKIKQQAFSKVQLENLRLQKENQILRRKYQQSEFKYFRNKQNKLSKFQEKQRISQINFNATECKQDESQIKLELRKQIRQLNQKIFELKNQSMKLKQNLVICEDSLNTSKQQKSQLSKKVGQLKNQNQNICSELVKVSFQNQNSKAKLLKWRSTIAFQREEISSYQSQLNSIKNDYKDINRKYKLLLKRFNNLVSNSNNNSPNGISQLRLSEQLNTKYFQTFKEQLQIFCKIRTIFNNKQSQNNLDKTLFGNQKKLFNSSGDSNYKNYLTQKQTANNINGVKRLQRQHYAYFKPSFYNFVEGYMDLHGIDSTTIQHMTSGFDVNWEFLTTIRAILDSKFNQFHFQTRSQRTNFANFTYVWLSKFKIHRKQKKVIQIKGDSDKQAIPTFFMNLMSQKLNSNWEIIAFRQFLMESLTLDELYFYLMARNYIMKGSLLENISGIYQQTYFVNIADALNLMQKFITDINYRKKVQQYIKRFIVYARKRTVIDIHLILRILLEFYQAKKHQQFINLYSLTQLLTKSKNSILSFDQFLKIFQYNFLYLSLTEKLQVYTKAFSSSKGKITLEVILTVITQEGHLCKEVKQIFNNDPINTVKKSANTAQEQIIIEPSLPELIEFQKFFQMFHKQNFQVQTSDYGLDSLKHQFLKVKQFHQTNIFSRIQIVFTHCLSVLKKVFYSKKISTQNFMSILKQIVDMSKRLNKLTCQKKSIMDLMSHFKRDSAAKKILRFYRKKRNQMHRNFIFCLKDQTLEEDQKVLNIRKQFNFMIQNLKEKFTSQEA